MYFPAFLFFLVLFFTARFTFLLVFFAMSMAWKRGEIYVDFFFYLFQTTSTSAALPGVD